MNDPRDLAEALRRLRGRRTQREVAAEAGLDPTVWSLYEGGERWPRRASFERLAKGLGCPPERIDEEMLLVRRRRLEDQRWDPAGGVAEPAAAPYGLDGDDEALRREVRGHLEAVHQHLESLFGLLLRKPRG
jgi:transcriptional regulator with XRE-family HTH domain